MKFGPDADLQRAHAARPSAIAAEISENGWRDIARELRALGFIPSADGITGDFIAMDRRDGRGPFIAAWLSPDHECPFPEMLGLNDDQKKADADFHAHCLREHVKRNAPPKPEKKRGLFGRKKGER